MLLSKHLNYLLLCVLTAILAACGGAPAPTTDTPTDTPGGPLELSDTASGYTGAEGSVVATMLGSLAEVSSGEVSADGSFTLELPGSVPENKLSTPETFTIWSCATGTLEFSTPDWAVDQLAPLEVRSGSAVAGTLDLSNRVAVGGSQLGIKRAVPMYSLGALSVTGVCDDGLGATTTYNLQLEPGWNWTVQEVTDELGSEATVETVAAVPDDVSWRFTSYTTP